MISLGLSLCIYKVTHSPLAQRVHQWQTFPFAMQHPSPVREAESSPEQTLPLHSVVINNVHEVNHEANWSLAATHTRLFHHLFVLCQWRHWHKPRTTAVPSLPVRVATDSYTRRSTSCCWCSWHPQERATSRPPQSRGHCPDLWRYRARYLIDQRWLYFKNWTYKSSHACSEESSIVVLLLYCLLDHGRHNTDTPTCTIWQLISLK